MLKKLFSFALSSGLAALAWKLWVERENKLRLARARRERAQDLQRWEDEGGNPAPTATRGGD